MLSVVDQGGDVRDELGELSVPLGEEDLNAGFIGVLVDDLLGKFLIQSFLFRTVLRLKMISLIEVWRQ